MRCPELQVARSPQPLQTPRAPQLLSEQTLEGWKMHSSPQRWEVEAELNASPGGLQGNLGGSSGWRWGWGAVGLLGGRRISLGTYRRVEGRSFWGKVKESFLRIVSGGEGIISCMNLVVSSREFPWKLEPWHWEVTK